MPTLPRTSLLRGPLAVVAIFVLALLALYPGASLRGQSAPAAAARDTVTPAGRIDGEVSDMVVKGRALEIRYRNTGTVATEILGELQVRDASGELVHAEPFVEGRRIAAGRGETFKVPMPTLPAGSYRLYAVVDFGGASLTAAEAALEIRP